VGTFPNPNRKKVKTIPLLKHAVVTCKEYILFLYDYNPNIRYTTATID
jgi:hypothetical protein